MTLKIGSALLPLSSFAFALERGEEIRLWPNGAPGSEGITAPEVFGPAGAKVPRRFALVHYPSIYAFLPPKEIASGMAVVVAPGGGHWWLNMNVDGWPIADWLNQNGIAAFVLKYRLAKEKDSSGNIRDSSSHYTVEGNSFPDAARAIRLVRSRAKEWGIDPARIGIMGLSAGGEVAAFAETRFDTGKNASGDGVERTSSRPDFAVLVYPGFKPGSIAVPKDAPPTFLVCTDEDRPHAESTAQFYLELEKEGVSTEMHMYATGAHGFGMKPLKLPVATWPDRLKAWMVDRKLLAVDRAAP